jgi:hypothetical protein
MNRHLIVLVVLVGIGAGFMASAADYGFLADGSGLIADGLDALAVATSAVPPAPPAFPPRTNELMIWYAFDADTNALDQYTNKVANWSQLYSEPASGAAHPTWVNPGGGKSAFASFDGGDSTRSTNGFRNTPADTTAFLSTNNSLSWCMWVRADTVALVAQYLYGGYTYGAYDYPIHSAEFRYGGTFESGNYKSNAISVPGYLAGGWPAGSPLYYGDRDTATVTGEWVHVFVVVEDGVYDGGSFGASPSVAVYTNLTLVPSVSNHPYIYDPCTGIVLGRRAQNTNFKFYGDLDEFMHWRTNLTFSERGLVYSNQVGGH